MRKRIRKLRRRMGPMDIVLCFTKERLKSGALCNCIGKLLHVRRKPMPVYWEEVK